MGDTLIVVLQSVKLVIIVLGVASILLTALVIMVEFSSHVELESIHIITFRRRVGRHRRTIKVIIFEFYDEMSEFKKDLDLEKERWRNEKEQAARGGGFFDAFYAPKFNTDGSLVYPHGIIFPTELSEKYHRKLDEIADKLIFDNTEVL